MTRTAAEPSFTPAPRATTAAARPPLPRSRDELQARLDLVRSDGFAADPAALDPATACIAVPWPQPGFPSAIACLAPPVIITASTARAAGVHHRAVRGGRLPGRAARRAARPGDPRSTR